MANCCSLARAHLPLAMRPFASCKLMYTHDTHTWRPNFSNIYYSPRGYWKGLAAIKQLAAAAKVSGDVAKQWLTKQALWQIYLPGSRYIPRPKFDVSLPNAVHQADLLFLPHDKLPRGKKVYKYALTVVDVASRYKAAEALTSKESDEVSRGFAKIYKRGPLKWPQLLQVDPGREFMGAVTKMANEHNVTIRRGRPNIHRDQAIVERFNRTLAERLFGYQYAVEMNMSIWPFDCLGETTA